MPSIRRRFTVAAGTLLGLQLLGTALGFASWWRVHEACMHQLRIAEQRDLMLQLGSAAREVYVHQAHTFIEGGPGHLDHYAEVVAEVDAKLAEVVALPLPTAVEVEPVQMALVRANEWFAFEVVPAAREGRLDRKTATLLHTESERRALDVEHAIGQALASLTDAQARELENVTRETTRAWIAVGLLSLGGVGLAALVTRRLGKKLVAPFLAVAEAARAFARGEPAVMPTSEDDEIRAVATAFNQMTAQVRDAEERRLENGRLAALGEMSAAVAHELLNPLSVVLAEPVLQRSELTAVRSEAEHMKKVVQGLLGFARPATDPVATLDLAEVVKEAVDRAWPFADARNVAISVGDVHRTTVVASPTAMRQVLDNLIQNAIQASEPDGTIEIHLRAGAVVEILDRGRGIPADVLDRLYDPFVTGRHEGTGLGLAIASRIVRAQGGTLAHSAREGGGTIARWELNRG